jgi:hypothetical protein
LGSSSMSGDSSRLGICVIDWNRIDRWYLFELEMAIDFLISPRFMIDFLFDYGSSDRLLVRQKNGNTQCSTMDCWSTRQLLADIDRPAHQMTKKVFRKRCRSRRATATNEQLTLTPPHKKATKHCSCCRRQSVNKKKWRARFYNISAFSLWGRGHCYKCEQSVSKKIPGSNPDRV